MPWVALWCRRQPFTGREVWGVEVESGLGASPRAARVNAVVGHTSARAALRAARQVDPEAIHAHLRGGQ